ncbi:MAG: hypothetical protein EOO15_05000 [Chitinophagaceae bacterium]|nr:MAG: hypothetical protein EOO15_05000 [Chitinophagaceae bacterium]
MKVGFCCSALLLLLASCGDPATVGQSKPAPPVVDSPAAAAPTEAKPISNASVIDTAAKVGPLSGAHRLTLQWISWDNPGTVYFTATGDSTYRIRGEQKGAGGAYLRIEGTVRQESAKKLLFKGRVEHRTSTTNAGQPCVKEGEQVFLSTKGRQYWRMQDMQNCEGGMVTDYVDIYFR